MTSVTIQGRASKAAAFPPYELLGDDQAGLDLDLERGIRRAEDKTRRLSRLYHQTQAHAWDPREVLDQLVAEHGEIRVPPDMKEAMGRVFSVLLWGELAAWNVATDLARWLPDLDARMAATGQAFDEARHFTVLRDYLKRAGIAVPPVNPFGRRLLVRIIDTPSMLEKLYGMQLTVETLALGIFKGLENTGIEPVLSGLLKYIERDESRHVALGVLYLPQLLAQASPYERAKNWRFTMECFALTIAGGELLDADWKKLGLDHRLMGLDIMRLHEQTLQKMREENGSRRITGVYTLSRKQHIAMIDFLHPAPTSSPSWTTRTARAALGKAVKVAGRVMV